MRVLNLNNLNFGILIRHPVPRILRPSARIRNLRRLYRKRNIFRSPLDFFAVLWYDIISTTKIILRFEFFKEIAEFEFRTANGFSGHVHAPSRLRD